jgi:hypothetical protein
MPDWREFVSQRLRGLGFSRQREEEICAELGEHLEDAYLDALKRGLSPEAAMAAAQREVSDWRRLSRKIRHVGREERTMSHTARTLWMPGITMLLIASALLLIAARLFPAELWSRPGAPGALLAPWLAAYLVFGAAGAWWSRRAGGSTAVRFFAGTFPLTLHLVVFLLPILVALLVEAPRHPEHVQAAFLLRAALGWVVIPGVALAIGTLPFLRNQEGIAAQVGAQGTVR